jgi:hypothetical protein
MIELLPPNYWHWWILAAILIMLEFFALGTFGSFFLWPAIAAIVIGFLTWLVPELLNPESQVLILAIVSIISVVVGRLYLGEHPLSSDEPFLNRRGSELVGRTYYVSEAIVNGIGRIFVDDSSWRVEGPDCPVGTQVKVVKAGTVRLQVEPKSKITKTILGLKKIDG